MSQSGQLRSHCTMLSVAADDTVPRPPTIADTICINPWYDSHMLSPPSSRSGCVMNSIARSPVHTVYRMYSLHEQYVFEVGRRSYERWLLQKCKDLEFYSNLKQHSDLCTEVCFFRLWPHSSLIRACILIHAQLHRWKTMPDPACSSGH
jgi:hypothetical protein